MTEISNVRKPTNSDEAGHDSSKKRKSSDTKLLMELAEKHLTICKNREGRAMVAQSNCSHLFHPLSATGCEPLSRLFTAFYAQYDRVPSRNARAQLLDMLSFEANISEPTEVAIRCVHGGGSIWLDTGWSTGEVIRITQDGWCVLPASPCAFTRGQVTGGLPDPREVEPDLKALASFVNCTADDLPLVYAALLTSWFSDVPQPVLSLFGPADSGKTTALQFLVDLADPSTTQAGGTLEVKDVRSIKAQAGARRILVFDNVSSLNAAESDMVAKVATGGELLTRVLYTDDQAHVTQLMRPVWMNGIMEGVGRSDLASRLVVVRLESLDSSRRVPWSALQRNWASSRRSILAGMLDLLVEMLRVRECISDENCDFRMVDYQRNLRAIDLILGTFGEQRLLRQTVELSDIVLESTPLGEAFKAVVSCSRGMECSYCLPGSDLSLFATTWSLPELRDLLTQHTPESLHRFLPGTAAMWGQALTRMRADLNAALQIDFEKPRSSKIRRYQFRDLTK